MVQYGIVSWQLCVTPVSWWTCIWLDGQADAFFFESMGQNYLQSFAKNELFPILLFDEILEPRNFFHANNTEKNDWRTWHPQKLARFRRRYPSCSASISNSCVRIAPYLHNISSYHMKVRHPSKKGKCCMDFFHRVFCVQKPWLIILYRDRKSVV